VLSKKVKLLVMNQQNPLPQAFVFLGWFSKKMAFCGKSALSGRLSLIFKVDQQPEDQLCTTDEVIASQGCQNEKLLLVFQKSYLVSFPDYA
jgi:hypothetical protein